MNTDFNSKKIVYVLVSAPHDHFTEMAILSVTCARKFSPNLIIEIVMDRVTYDQLEGYRKNILSLVDKVNVIDIEGKNNAFISRNIKTQLRSFVDGDYLYIDIDAIPVADLANVFKIETDIAMVNDHNLPPHKFVFLDYEREIFDKMGWELPKQYFNSGVMYVRDNARTHNFFTCWHDLWLQNCAIGLHKDQPAMHEAINQMNIKVDQLSPGWNFLIGCHKALPPKRHKIYHYSTVHFDTRSDTYFHEIVKNMKINGEIDFELLNKIIKAKYPWTNTDSIRLNWGVGNYYKLTQVLFKRFINLFVKSSL